MKSQANQVSIVTDKNSGNAEAADNPALCKFLDLSATVLIADPSTAARLSMVSVYRALGFNNTIAVASLNEALPILSRGEVDWLVTSLFPREPVNALQILKMAREHNFLQNLCVTLCVANDEDHVLGPAFALGLFSYHQKPFGKDECTAFVLTLLEDLNRHRDESLVAAQFLRQYLRSQKDFESILTFENTLVQRNPQNASLLLGLAEVHFELGNELQARSLLWQAEERDPSLKSKAHNLGVKFLNSNPDKQSWQSQELKLGVCVIVDPDIAVVNATKSALSLAGAKAIHTFADGDAFWQWLLSNNPPDLIVMEWRVPKLSGPVILQRMRARGMYRSMVMITSSMVKRTDLILLEEIGVTTVLEKPAGTSSFLNCLAALVDQSRNPSGKTAMESRIRTLLANSKINDASDLMKEYVLRVDQKDQGRLHLEAEFAFYFGDYFSARDLALAALAQGKKSVLTLNLLGKTLMRLREFPAALQVFERAQEVSPDSVERLCLMAETQSDLGESAQALATIAKASDIDAENSAVLKMGVNLALVEGDSVAAFTLLEKVPPSHNILAYTNNRAVAYAKAGQFKSSISLYANALLAIPDFRTDLKAVVLYNLALAQIQDNDIVAALSSLVSIPERSPNDHLEKKVKSLKQRVQDSIRAGSQMRLNQEPLAPLLMTKPALSDQKFVRFKTSLDEKQKNNLINSFKKFCLFGIYTSSQPKNTEIEALLAEAPKIGSPKSAPSRRVSK